MEVGCYRSSQRSPCQKDRRRARCAEREFRWGERQGASTSQRQSSRGDPRTRSWPAGCHESCGIRTGLRPPNRARFRCVALDFASGSYGPRGPDPGCADGLSCSARLPIRVLCSVPRRDRRVFSGLRRGWRGLRRDMSGSALGTEVERLVQSGRSSCSSVTVSCAQSHAGPMNEVRYRSSQRSACQRE